MATVLVVDDHPENRELLVTLLAYKGHWAIEATDGAEALALVRSERPALVISDILMPTMDGFEFVRQLRGDPAIAQTEVIFYTAHYHEREARNLALACGVSRVLIKPCDPEEILRTIEQALAHQPPSNPAPVEQQFDREHLRLMTDKLSAKLGELGATNLRLNALTAVNLGLASERDPRALLDQVCRDSRNLVSARFAILCVRDKNELEGLHFASSGFDATAAAGLPRPRLDEGLFAEILARRTALRLATGDGGPRNFGLPEGFPGVRSLLAAPIVSLHSIYGGICLLDKVGFDAFSEEDEKMLAMVAAQVGRIYENGSLYIEVKRKSEQLEAELVERGRATEALCRSEARLNEAQYNALIGSWHYLPDGALSWSDMMYELFRLPRDIAPTYDTMQAAIHPEDRVGRHRIFMAALESGAPDFHSEYRVEWPDGQVRTFFSIGKIHRDATGRVVEVTGTVQDVTDRVRDLAQLQESRERLSGLVESAMDAIVTVDHEQVIVFFNPAGETMFGYSPGEVIGRSLDILIPQSMRNAHRDQVRNYERTNVTSRRMGALRTVQGVRKNGETFLLEASISQDDRSGRRYFTAILRDITERVRTQEEVKRLNAGLERRVAERTSELEAANRELEAFDYSISHDLRGPLARLLGFAGAIAEDYGEVLDDRGRQYVERIRSSAQRMDQLVEDLLALSMVARGELRRTDVDVSGLADAILGALQKAHPERDVDFVLAPGLAARADLGLVRIVLDNLLGNAWKFTGRRAGARIEVTSRQESGETVFVVRDNGAGFDPANADKLFAPFRRLHDRNEFEGTGIGLATVRRIINRHGGRIGATGAVGEGAAFEFTLAPRPESA